MKKSLLTICMLAVAVTTLSYLLGSCRKDSDTGGLTRMDLEIPDGFPEPVHRFEDNPLTKEGFELGRRLFYDGRLSIDNLHPCSSCHEQKAGFGTFEHDRSHGVFESHTLRNAPVLFNLAWSPWLHWDGAFTRLTDAIAQPINGHIEMGESYAGIIRKIQDDPYYKEAFKKVFRHPFIRPEHILKALAQFTGSLVSANSKYDRVRQGLASFNGQENNGYQLFRTHCAGCHPEPLFTDHGFHNTGLPVDPQLNDLGLMMISKKSEDSLRFRTPTLRNVFISSNYMHDGRFGTLAQCINHYRFGVQQGPTLDPLLQNGINLSNSEATDLGLFLRTLTDSSFLRDSRYSRPR